MESIFFSLRTYSYFKKSFLTKVLLYFSNQNSIELNCLFVAPAHETLMYCDLHPKFYHQTRGDYYILLSLDFPTGFLRERVFFLLTYAHFSLNIPYSFLHSWSLSYCCWMNYFNNTFTSICKYKICHLVFRLVYTFNHIRPQFPCYT